MARNAHRVFLPDRGHLHHRLLEAGMSHRSAVLSLYGCAIALAVAALVLVVMNSVTVAILLAGSLTVLTVAFLALVTVRARLARHRQSAVADPRTAAEARNPRWSSGTALMTGRRPDARRWHGARRPGSRPRILSGGATAQSVSNAPELVGFKVGSGRTRALADHGIRL